MSDGEAMVLSAALAVGCTLILAFFWFDPPEDYR